MMKLRGAFTALITPMNADESVDYEGFRKLVRYQLESGISGLVPLGTTGETPTLDEAEEDKLIDIVMAEAKGKVPVILGAGSNCTRDAVKYVKRAKQKGADYALVVTPYYNKPTDEGIYRHFAACCEVGLPIIVYNMPGRTGKNISTPLMARLAELPNIAGVKEASGDIGQMGDVIALIKARRPDFAVFSGDDGLTLPLLALGGDGVISVLSNLAPKEVTEMTLAGLSGDFTKARAMHFKLLPAFKDAFIETNPIPIKAAMNMKGLPAGTLRLPLVSLSKEHETKLRASFAAAGLL
ncbi:MAG TPA: 4-hydroxy-tetrahydrodipicolinate synthase [Treponemataceae bacterium]|nr:4-hydroxy-tetrahydrodipicolinate synthase [Treponemataceae bacterium]HPS44302.1 4-hydroxy-tetrahydrodipicolinate synthase [Treponemataceae bacterium]